MTLRFILLLLSVVSASSTDSTSTAADETTCSIEWEKDHGLIMHRRKIILETVGELLSLTQDSTNNNINGVHRQLALSASCFVVETQSYLYLPDFSSHGGRKLRSKKGNKLRSKKGNGGGGGGGDDDCSDAEQQIKDGIAAFKSGEVQGGRRYLEMFHKDAKVNMLAGHTEDGHEIHGREHLARFMSDPFGSRNPRDGKYTKKWILESTTTDLTAFVDSEYSSKRSDDGNFCIVYLSVLMTITTSGDTVTTVTTEGLVRYDVADDESVISKLSLNVNTGQSDPCSTDRDVDATYGVRE